MGDLSEHFSRREFPCKHCGRLPARVVPQLVDALEALRARGYARRPGGLIVRSGYRCRARQAQLRKADPKRAAKRSQHCECAAADFDPALELHVALDLEVFSGVGWQMVDGVPMAVHGDVRHASGFNPTRSTVTHPAVWQYR
jgi:uncharacterized protein YcbK (DUF882 family)